MGLPSLLKEEYNSSSNIRLLLNKKLHRVLSLEPWQTLRINATAEQAESITSTSKCTCVPAL